MNRAMYGKDGFTTAATKKPVAFFMVFGKRALLSVSIIVLLSISGCKKTSTEILNEMVDSSAVLQYSGNFIGQGGQNVSGKAEIYLEKNKYILKLTNFTSDNGPDLKVYLSKGAAPQEHISLGDLKSTNGSQLYDIQGTPDFNQFKYTLVHCEKYNHRYGSAELK